MAPPTNPMVWPWMWPVWAFMSPMLTFNVRADNWDYRPMTEWGEGDIQVERRVHRDLASPGRQLGILADAVLELAGKADALDGPAVARLQRLADEIEKIKAEVHTGAPALRKI